MNYWDGKDTNGTIVSVLEQVNIRTGKNHFLLITLHRFMCITI